MVLILFFAGWVVLRQRNWFAHPGRIGYAVLVVSGVLLALGVEWTGVYLLRRWTYTAAMPRIPGTGIGVLPILQMAILPALVFRLVVGFQANGKK